MRAVDTNVLIRLLVRDDAAQLRAAERFVGSGAWVPVLVLAKTVCVLDAVYERSAAQIDATVTMLLKHEPLSLQDGDVVASELEPYRQRLRGIEG